MASEIKNGSRTQRTYAKLLSHTGYYGLYHPTRDIAIGDVAYFYGSDYFRIFNIFDLSSQKAEEIGIPPFGGTREISRDNHVVYPMTSERATIRRGNVNVNVLTSGVQWRLEVEKATSNAAICIPTQPTAYQRLKEVHHLREWWEKYRYNIASRYQKSCGSTGVFLVLSLRTTPQYGNCCANQGSGTNTSIDVTAPLLSPETLSIGAGGQFREVTRTFGFEFGPQDPTLSDWVIFITRHKAHVSGPFKKFVREIQSVFHQSKGSSQSTNFSVSSKGEAPKSTLAGDSNTTPTQETQTSNQKTHNFEMVPWSDEWVIIKNEDQFFVGHHGDDDLEELDEEDYEEKLLIRMGVLQQLQSNQDSESLAPQIDAANNQMAAMQLSDLHFKADLTPPRVPQTGLIPSAVSVPINPAIAPKKTKPQAPTPAVQQPAIPLVLPPPAPALPVSLPPAPFPLARRDSMPLYPSDPPPEYSKVIPNWAERYEAGAFESTSTLVIGIDFGTTFTGVAYYHSSASDSKDPKKIAENVNVVKTWPNLAGQNTEKIPTVVAYEGGQAAAWGGTVRFNHKVQVQHFKLGLHERAAAHYKGEAKQVTTTGFMSDPNWKHPDLPQDKKAVDYAADYLTKVRAHIMDQFLPNQFGDVFLRNQQIAYVITVPAIWSDKAKHLTSQAASRAGIPQENLQLITEPEAAALYCATMCDKVDLNDGDRFVICDAGGGTADLISYKVISRDPFSVAECTVGMGAACGSIYLDKGFEELLRGRLGAKADQILTPRILSGAQRHFDSLIKCQYNPYDEYSEEEYEIPLPGALDQTEISLEGGYLKLTKADIQIIFDPIFAQILALVQKQIQAVVDTDNVKMKILFLVGGLGSNRYLGEFLKDKLKGTIDVKQPMAGYSAIMRGAVLYKMGMNMVKERVMRRHYGLVISDKFREGYDPDELKFRGKDGTWRCRDILHWFANKGAKIPNRHVIEHSFSVPFWPYEYERPGPLKHVIPLLACEADVPPFYLKPDTGVATICSIDVDLRNLPVAAFKKITADGQTTYSADFELAIAFGPVMEFRLLYQKTLMGSAVAHYQ